MVRTFAVVRTYVFVVVRVRCLVRAWMWWAVIDRLRPGGWVVGVVWCDNEGSRVVVRVCWSAWGAS